MSDRIPTHDESLIDALEASHFDLDSMDRSDARARKLHGLLSLLDTSLETSSCEKDRELLVDVTMARVLRDRDRSLAGRITPQEEQTLLPRDQDAIDAHFGEGRSADSTRSSKVAGLLALLDVRASHGNADQRIDATLARIQQSIDEQSARCRLAPPDESQFVSSRRFRLSDLVGVAAMLMIGTAILWPILVGLRQNANDLICASGLQRAAIGFSMFGADHDGYLPGADRPIGQSGPWWNVGQGEQSHSANLFLLVRKNYVSMSDLACPGCRNAPEACLDHSAQDWKGPEEVSYSYQIFGPERLRWQQEARNVVLADKSPVIPRARRGEPFDPMAQSRNHAGRGQNILFSDASVEFLNTPVLANGDNIWLPRAAERATNPSLHGVERSAGAHDAFVGP